MALANTAREKLVHRGGGTMVSGVPCLGNGAANHEPEFFSMGMTECVHRTDGLQNGSDGPVGVADPNAVSSSPA